VSFFSTFNFDFTREMKTKWLYVLLNKEVDRTIKHSHTPKLTLILVTMHTALIAIVPF